MSVDLTSTAFGAGALIPKKFTGGGTEVSPLRQWTTPPKATNGDLERAMTGHILAEGKPMGKYMR